MLSLDIANVFLKSLYWQSELHLITQVYNKPKCYEMTAGHFLLIRFVIFSKLQICESLPIPYPAENTGYFKLTAHFLRVLVTGLTSTVIETS
jgi:hypothetical protein